MFERLEDVQARLGRLDDELMLPETQRNPARIKELNQERAHLTPVVETWAELSRIEAEIEEARILRDDPDMSDTKVKRRRALSDDEIGRLEKLIPDLRTRLRTALLPPDPYEGRDIILEIRAGTGGDETALFAGDLFRMYLRYCDVKRWKVEMLSSSEIAVGGSAGRGSNGFKGGVCQIHGADAYRHLKYESGVHRVQRIPLTETQGRIHTSAATVAILPVAEAVEVDIQEKDLRIDVFRAGGPGGQSVNTTDSAVRITHIPTGMVVQCQDEKSQTKNKSKAMKVLAARMLEAKQAEQQAREAADRKAQVGSGDRSERIRTYNFPQNRITDHRIGLTLYQLDKIILGELEELMASVGNAFQAQALAGNNAFDAGDDD